VDVNVKGTFFASQAAGRVIQQGFGRIVNLGSQAGSELLSEDISRYHRTYVLVCA
jgi:NAD(P)-dependent dehydrogenase (short-subunit alcohol dehydrogenase family)